MLFHHGSTDAEEPVPLFLPPEFPVEDVLSQIIDRYLVELMEHSSEWTKLYPGKESESVADAPRLPDSLF